MKPLIIASIIFLTMSASCTGGGRGDGPVVKIYVSKPDLGGFQRSQTQTVIPYNDTLNYRCMDKDDFDALIKYCFNPDSGSVREIRNALLKIKNKKKREKMLNNIVYNINALIIEAETQI